MFSLSITKSEIRELPVLEFPGEIFLVDDRTSFQHAMDLLGDATLVGFDSETKPSFKKGVIHPVALMQIATADQAFLFRLNKIGIPNTLANFLNHEELLKIGIGLDDDIQKIRKLNNISREGFVDLNDYCKEKGFENYGVKNLSAMILNKRVLKGQQTSNWEAEKLSEAQMRYAAIDAWVCREIYLKMKSNGF